MRRLLCEGGARVFANLLDAHLVDEEFVTLSPASSAVRRTCSGPATPKAWRGCRPLRLVPFR
ncbi:MAG: hypothetical protein R2838_19295 [Caldilineaceae bacterium]